MFSSLANSPGVMVEQIFAVSDIDQPDEIVIYEYIKSIVVRIQNFASHLDLKVVGAKAKKLN